MSNLTPSLSKKERNNKIVNFAQQGLNFSVIGRYYGLSSEMIRKICFVAGITGKNTPRLLLRHKYGCNYCGRIFFRNRKVLLQPLIFCSRKCSSLFKKILVKKSGFGNRIPSTYRYVYKYVGIKNGTSRYRQEHRILMEEYLGRKLNKNEVVHHINGNGRDNRIINLKIIKLSKHSRLHASEFNQKLKEIKSKMTIKPIYFGIEYIKI